MSRFVTVRSRRLSLWQSAVHEATGRIPKLDPASKKLMRQAASRHAELASKGMHIPRSAHTPGAPLTLDDHVVLSSAYLDLADGQRTGNQAQVEAALVIIRGYSEYDPNWVTCVTVYTQYYITMGKQAVYVDWSQQSPPVSISTFGVLEYQLPNNAQVLMLGDWGTGMTDAVGMLTAALEQLQPNAIIHLGDVYYSGTGTECTDNVVTVLQQAFQNAGLKTPIPFFSIPGNHEYYSGGQGFYTMLGQLNAGMPGCQQQASYFCLRTQDQTWQFLAMDTGINDHNADMDALGTIGLNPTATGPGLVPSEAEWHADKLENFAGNTLLLSHHQLFSANAAINGSLTSDPPYINSSLFDIFLPYFGQISAWFWGHEHSFAYYQDFLFGLNKGRLLGCSAYEELQSQDPYTVNYPAVGYPAGMAQVGQSSYLTNGASFYDHALALIDFTRSAPTDAINVTYYQFPSWDQDTPTPSPLPTLQSLYSETIGAPSVPRGYVWTGNDPISIPPNDPESNFGPSLAVFTDGYLYMAYKGAHSNNLYLAWFDGTTWYGNQQISTSNGAPESNYSPALAVFNGYLYMVYKGAHSNSLYLAWFDGTTWYGNQQISTSNGSPESNYAPALAVFNGLLYMIYKGESSNTLYFAWFDGTTWYGNQQISIPNNDPESNYSPAAAVYAAPPNYTPMLYITYKGESSNTLYCAWFDGTTWYGNQAISTSNGSPESNYCPWMAALGDRLIMIYKGESSNTIYQAVLDGSTWSGNVPLGSFSPIAPETNLPGSVVPYGDGLYMVYTGEISDTIYEAQLIQVGTVAATEPRMVAVAR
ncbi:MAG TPA: metallophosphoesterase [Candidatus Eisenbacteria bacterium]|nr:metallophosphoesterase [Candidatus Eisenbacteria bacterium]